jgi:monofunctional chorismate mutase
MDELEQLRSELDSVDDQIVNLVHKRLQISKKIGDYKKSNGIEVFQPGREKALLERIAEKSKELEMDPIYIVKIFELLIQNSKDIQRRR